MTIAFLVGRLVLGLYWVHAGYGHLFHSGNMVGYAQSKGVKSPKASIVFSGLLALLGGLSILLGAWTAWGIALLVIFLLGVSLKMHGFWSVQDPMARMNDRIQFWKNMALAGALLMLLAVPQPWAWSAF